jgi:hypothetical protein
MTPEAQLHCDRYNTAVRRMQTGVEFTMGHPDDKSTQPKHLRVGVNVAMGDHAGLAQLLMDKGVITEEEYFKAIADAAEREVIRYERLLNQRFPGKDFTLVPAGGI